MIRSNKSKYNNTLNIFPRTSVMSEAPPTTFSMMFVVRLMIIDTMHNNE